jgi:hypothetical protein
MARTTSASKQYLYIKRFSNCVKRGDLNKRNADTIVVKLPRHFSLIDNPNESLKSVAMVIKALREPSCKRVEIDHRLEKDNDYAAHALLAMCVGEYTRQVRNLGKKNAYISGYYPQDERIRRLMDQAGIVEAITRQQSGSSLQGKLSHRSYKLFKWRSLSDSEEPKFGSIDRQTQAASRFEEFLNEALLLVGRELTEDAEVELGKYIGEIIGNCEDHSTEKLWTAAAFVDVDARPYLCELMVFNFGISYAETFTRLDPSHFARKEVDGYVERHMHRKGMSRDLLYTVMALQGSVSSCNESSSDTRGYGTVDFIEFFEDISEECAGVDAIKIPECKMALISGAQHIFFDGTYKLKKYDGERRTIAFNRKNTLDDCPDPSAVADMKSVSFPGTIISIRFPLELATESDVLSGGDAI